jgi:hypothetical protein
MIRDDATPVLAVDVVLHTAVGGGVEERGITRGVDEGGARGSLDGGVDHWGLGQERRASAAVSERCGE